MRATPSQLVVVVWCGSGGGGGGGGGGRGGAGTRRARHSSLAGSAAAMIVPRMHAHGGTRSRPLPCAWWRWGDGAVRVHACSPLVCDSCCSCYCHCCSCSAANFAVFATEPVREWTTMKRG